MPEPIKPSGLKSVDRLQRFSKGMQRITKPRDFKGDAAKIKAAVKDVAKDVEGQVETFTSNIGEMAEVGSKNLDEKIAKPAMKFAKRIKKLL